MKKTKYPCRYCGKINIGRMYCTPSHKSVYYQNRRLDKIQNRNPDEYVKELLDKALPTVKFRKVQSVPYGRNKRSKEVTKAICSIYNDMKKDEIVRISLDQFGYVNPSTSTLYNVIRKMKLNVRVMSRRTTTNNKTKVWFYLVRTKGEDENDNSE